MVAEDIEGSIEGVGKAKIKLNATCEGTPRELVNDGPLLFSYDAESNEFNMSGDMIDRAGNTYSLDAIGESSEGKNRKMTLDIDMIVWGPDIILGIQAQMGQQQST